MDVILSIMASVIGPSTITITNNASYPVCEVVYESRYKGTFTSSDWVRQTKHGRVESGQSSAFIATAPAGHGNEIRLISYAGC